MAESDFVTRLAGRVQGEYASQGMVRSFWEFLDEVRQTPYKLLRTAAHYTRDMFRHFGSEEISVMGLPAVRHRLFDGVPSDPEGQRVVGQELCTDLIFRILRNFAQAGRADKLILMHGPNGSAKTTIADVIFRGLEAYSETPEGLLYRFSWVFPKGEVEGRSLGFGGMRMPREEMDTFAYLEPDQIAATVPSDMKTNPFFLVPRECRQEFLDEIAPKEAEFPRRHALQGGLGAKSRAIYEALLTAHQGDWKKVMRHIRVERLHMSRRYRVGAVTIEPQGNVDAEARQVTADLTLANLPPAVHNLRLFEVGGDLIDANRGVVEYSDFLKRPLEYNKYLLTTTEKGTIHLPGTLAYLDLVMIGSANEKQLDVFKTDANFTSFKGRIELVAVPYLLEYEKEVEIYRDQMSAIARRLEIAPHAARAAALWAVLTRLLRPDLTRYDEPARSAVSRMTPLAKALLYQGRDPGDLEDLSAAEVKVLRDNLPKIAAEYRDGVVYEGRFGASPREMKTILLDASYHRNVSCFTPITVLAELRNLVRDKTLYDFLKLEPKGAYNDPARFVDDVDRAVVRLVLREMKDSMSLVEEKEYDRRFEEYFRHVIAYVRGSRVSDPVSGEERAPDTHVLTAVEALLPTGDDIDLFRQNLIGKIGAYSVNRPGERVNFRELFPEILRALKADFYERTQESVLQVQSDLLTVDTPAFDVLSRDRKDRVEVTLENMRERFGYPRICAVEMIRYAIRKSRAEPKSE